MAHFWLIQRGKFVTDKPAKSLNIDQNISYDYMGSAEFEWGAIPKAFRRMMYHFHKYVTVHTGIFSPDGEELILFCKNEHADLILSMVKEFIANPYSLKEYSELEKIPVAKNNDTSWRGRVTDFWWNIDSHEYGDWMACMSPNADLLVKILTADHADWWMSKPEEEREKEYKDSLRW